MRMQIRGLSDAKHTSNAQAQITIGTALLLSGCVCVSLPLCVCLSVCLSQSLPPPSLYLSHTLSLPLPPGCSVWFRPAALSSFVGSFDLPKTGLAFSSAGYGAALWCLLATATQGARAVAGRANRDDDASAWRPAIRRAAPPKEAAKKENACECKSR